jgi:hypothetical protein
MRRSLALSLLALSLLALPAGAEVFRVTLNNGQIFETAYQPQEASWDASMVLLLDDVGNWVGVSKADVQQVATVSETGAYGVMISRNTFEIGISANDAEAQEAANGQPGQNKPSALETAQLQLAQLELQQRQAEIQRQTAQQNYGVKQFVEPGQTQGIPSRFIGQTPKQGGSSFPSTPSPSSPSPVPPVQ